MQRISHSLLVALLLMTVGCDKTDKSVDPNMNVPLGSYPNIFNSSNPEDSAGIRHNQVCSFILRRAHADTSSLSTLQKVIKYAKEFPDSIGISISNIDTVVGYHKWYVLNRRDRNPIELLQEADNPRFTEKEISYIRQIGGAISQVSTMSAMTDSITAIENRIVSESWASDEHGALVAVSILKHSWYFWQDYFDGGLQKSAVDVILIIKMVAWDIVAYQDAYEEEEADGDVNWWMVGLETGVSSVVGGVYDVPGFVVGWAIDAVKTVWDWFF